MPAAVARLVRLVAPSRLDLVDEVLLPMVAGISTSPWTGRRCTWCISSPTGWSGCTLEVRMRGPNGVVVDVIRYRDKMQQDRRVYRLTR